MRLDVENRLEEQHVVTTLWWAYSLVTNKIATTPCKTLCHVNTLLQHSSISYNSYNHTSQSGSVQAYATTRQIQVHTHL